MNRPFRRARRTIAPGGERAEERGAQRLFFWGCRGSGILLRFRLLPRQRPFRSFSFYRFRAGKSLQAPGPADIIVTALRKGRNNNIRKKSCESCDIGPALIVSIMEKKDIVAGYLLVAVSAVTFAAKGIFAKLLYGFGVDPVTLLALRFSIALPFFWAAVLFFPSPKVSWRDILYLVLSGLLGLYAAALADFYGLLYIDASLERVILYTYPAIVVIWAAVFFKEQLDRRKGLSLILTYAGLALVLKITSGVSRADATGAVLVLFSAVIYSLSYILTEFLSRRVSGVKIAAYGTTAATAAFLATWRGQSVPTEPEVWGLLLALSVVSTFVPVLTLALGIKRIGASRAALASFVGPVATALLAYFVLGETLDLVQIAGMGLVITGVLVISFDKPARAEPGYGYLISVSADLMKLPSFLSRSPIWFISQSTTSRWTFMTRPVEAPFSKSCLRAAILSMKPVCSERWPTVPG